MSYQVIARVEEVPEGQGKIVQVGTRQLLLWNIEGEMYALDSFCAHHGAPLIKGTLVEGQLLCPWHGTTFDVTTGTCPVAPEETVDTYPVEIRDGQVWAAME